MTGDDAQIPVRVSDQTLRNWHTRIAPSPSSAGKTNIAYLLTEQGGVYLAVVLDLFSRNGISRYNAPKEFSFDSTESGDFALTYLSPVNFELAA